MSQITSQHMGANQSTETAKCDSEPSVDHFEMLMHLFPDEHPSGIHGAMCITNNNMVEACDILLYIRQYRQMRKKQMGRPAVATAGISPMVSTTEPQPSTSTSQDKFAASTFQTEYSSTTCKPEFSTSTCKSDPSSSKLFTATTNLSNTDLTMDLGNRIANLNENEDDVIIVDSDDEVKDYVVFEPMDDEEIEFTAHGVVPPAFRMRTLYRGENPQFTKILH